ncbi:hypothetical protein GCM10009720_08930 [Yaniella flava]|uniref:HTH tetR-type domain-containing protein n=1 Tax=Yaniella flava TaxID=287930 RepID=A0ABP5FNT2_9MICC
MVKRKQSIKPDNTTVVASISKYAPKSIDCDSDFTVLLRVAAARLAKVPYSSVKIADVAKDAKVPEELIYRQFRDMHEIGSSILEHERSSMSNVQQRVLGMRLSPLEQLAEAFRMVGENLSKDIVVRAGVRIASESRNYFPDRRMDPFRTWEGFVSSQLSRAQDLGMIRVDLDLNSITWVIVAAGIGMKDILSVSNSWDTAPERFEKILQSINVLISSCKAGTSGVTGEAK